MDCIAHQASLSMEFSRQEYWSRLLFPSPGDLPDPGTEPGSPALAGGFFTTEPLEKPYFKVYVESLSLSDFPGGKELPRVTELARHAPPPASTAHA